MPSGPAGRRERGLEMSAREALYADDFINSDCLDNLAKGMLHVR